MQTLIVQVQMLALRVTALESNPYQSHVAIAGHTQVGSKITDNVSAIIRSAINLAAILPEEDKKSTADKKWNLKDEGEKIWKSVGDMSAEMVAKDAEIERLRAVESMNTQTVAKDVKTAKTKNIGRRERRPLFVSLKS